MSPWLALGAYVLGFIVTVRLTWIFADDTQSPDDNRFIATLFGVFWPIVAGIFAVVGVALAIFGLAWLLTWPTAGQRRARLERRRREEAEDAAALAEQHDLPYPQPPAAP
jgi:hypothetical protein